MSTKPQAWCPGFRESLQQYTKLLLTRLESEIRDDVPWDVEETWDRQEEILVRQKVNRRLWFIPFYRASDAVKESSEKKSCVEAMHGCSEISRHFGSVVGYPFSRAAVRVDDVINAVAYHMVAKADGPQYSDESFKEAYSELERYLRSDSFTKERITPLYGFVSDINEVRLDDDVSIDRLSSHELTELVGKGLSLGQDVGGVIHNVPTHTIRVSYQVPKLFERG